MINCIICIFEHISPVFTFLEYKLNSIYEVSASALCLIGTHFLVNVRVLKLDDSSCPCINRFSSFVGQAPSASAIQFAWIALTLFA